MSNGVGEEKGDRIGGEEGMEDKKVDKVDGKVVC